MCMLADQLAFSVMTALHFVLQGDPGFPGYPGLLVSGHHLHWDRPLVQGV